MVGTAERNTSQPAPSSAQQSLQEVLVCHAGQYRHLALAQKAKNDGTCWKSCRMSRCRASVCDRESAPPLSVLHTQTRDCNGLTDCKLQNTAMRTLGLLLSCKAHDQQTAMPRNT